MMVVPTERQCDDVMAVTLGQQSGWQRDVAPGSQSAKQTEGQQFGWPAA